MQGARAECEKRGWRGSVGLLQHEPAGGRRGRMLRLRFRAACGAAVKADGYSLGARDQMKARCDRYGVVFKDP